MKNNKSFLKGALIGALIMLLIVGTVGCVGLSFWGSAVDSKTESTLEHIQYLISQKYLYEDQIDDEAMQNGIIAGYVSGLKEPYSVYYNTEETQALMEALEGEMCGLGVLLTMDMNTYAVSIVEVYEDTPADKAGLKSGDIIYKVDGEEVYAEVLDEVVAVLRGEEGSEVEVTVLRGEELKEVTCNVTREKFTIPTVEWEMKEQGIGYIRLSEFDTVTTKQFKKAVKDLEKQGMQGLVLDLRNNPGGNLSTVCEIADMFLPEGTIVSTKDKNGKEDVYESDEKQSLRVPLTVLINGQSASASEILAACIQDYKIGTLVGTTTYGKGIVQEIYPLANGDSLKLTVSEYFTPNGENIHGVGVKPDVEVVYKESEATTDNQLEEAIRLLLERM